MRSIGVLFYWMNAFVNYPLKIVVLIFILSFDVEAQNSLSGTYKTNFSELGFFSTSITFAPNNEFRYRFAGDLLRDQAKGIYNIKNGYVTLTYDFKDSINLQARFGIFKDSLGNSLPFNFVNPAIVSRPQKFKISGNKLFFIHKQSGKVVRKTKGLSRRLRYLFWGDRHLMKRKHFLKKEK